MSNDTRRVLFCRSGGGLPGLDIHAGIWLALDAAGIQSTHCSGTSAGAIVSACDATGRSPHHFIPIIKNMRDSDVRRERFMWRLRALWIDWFLSSEPVLEQLNKLLPSTPRDLKKTLQVWATRENDGIAYCLDQPFKSLSKQVFASMAIAGVFPPVTFGEDDTGPDFSDGGPTNYCALTPGWQSYDEVWLLIATPNYKYQPKRQSVVSRAIMNVQVLTQRLIRSQIAEVEQHPQASQNHFPDVYVIRPTCGQESGMLHFDHSLIGKAKAEAAAQIEMQIGH